MPDYIVQDGYNVEALGAKNNLGTAPDDKYFYGHYPPGQHGAIHDITYPGQVMYWVIFCSMAASAIAFAAWTFSKPMEKRAHGYITTAIVTIAAIAYYVMAAHGGSAHILNPDGNIRDIYYARYIDWFFTTPLLLLDILLMADVSLGTALWVVLADVAMIVTGLFGALSINQYRWGYYVLSCFFFLVVLVGLFGPALQGANAHVGKTRNAYMGLSAYLAFFWIGYPIVWGFCEGSDYATVTAEAIAYGFLDFFTKVIFGWAVMITMALQPESHFQGSILTNSANNPFASSIAHSARGKQGHGVAEQTTAQQSTAGSNVPTSVQPGGNAA